MFYYKLKEDKTIECFAEIKQGEAVPSFMQDWLQTEDKIIQLHDKVLGSFVFEKDADMVAEQKAIAKLEAIKQIGEYEQKLSATDYIASKIAEGVATREEYAEQLANRAEWRKAINDLRGQL